MAKKPRKKSAKKAVDGSLSQRRLDKDVESLDLLEEAPTEEDFQRVINGHSSEAFELRKRRKAVRYRLSRIQTMILGGCDAEDHEGLQQVFEGLENFGGWRLYRVTWDVSMDDPFRIVHKDRSERQEWEDIIRAKFPTIEPGTGKISYPDITVKEQVQKHHGRT